MPRRNVSSWALMISAYAKQGRCEESIDLFREMQQEGIVPDKVIVVVVLKACASLASLEQGKQVHAYIIKSGLESDVFVGSTLVHMYAKCGCIKDALQVFRKMPQRNVVVWTAMISGYAQQGHGEEAIMFFKQMLQEGVKPNNVTFACVLKACSSMAFLEQGRRVHSLVIKSAFESDVFVGNSLIEMYVKCGSIQDARQVFNEMCARNVVTWTLMITGYTQQGHCNESLILFEQMQREGVKPDAVTFVTVLKACTSLADVERGKHVHTHILTSGLESDVFVASTLVDMYAKCGSLEDARQVFNKMHKRNTVSWNAMISGYAMQGYGEEALALLAQMQMEGFNPDVATWNVMIGGYAQQGHGQKAFSLFKQMKQDGVKPNTITFVSLLKACASLGSLERGKEVHAYVIKSGFESDGFVSNTLVDMYAKCGSIEDARQVFNKMGNRDVISWNAMIAGYIQQGLSEDALTMFRQMQKDGLEPNEVTFASVLKACSNLADLERGRQVHACIIKSGFESDVFVGSTLIDMYAKCGSIQDAHHIFNKMRERSVISWTAMIAGYAQQGNFEKALRLFEQMLQEGIKPDKVSFINILKSCASLVALEWGKHVHAHIINSGFESDVLVGNALVDFYGKCGGIENALQVFNNICCRDTVSWNSIITGYAQQGLGKEVLTIFKQMLQFGMKPDEITFVSVLSACSHTGLVDVGFYLFPSMIQDHDITPAVEHYVCMVDLLGRAGCLNEAEDFINKIPFQPNAMVWVALLGACRSHGNMELGRCAFECVLKLEPKHSGAYVLISNIYAAAGMWDEISMLREEMASAGVKEPEDDWIEANGNLEGSDIPCKHIICP